MKLQNLGIVKLAVALTVISSVPALADGQAAHSPNLRTFHIDLGEDRAVCKDFLLVLNAVGDWTKIVRNTSGGVTYVPLGSPSHGFSYPSWQVIKVEDNLDRVRRLYAQHLLGRRIPAEQALVDNHDEIEKQVQADIAGGKARLEFVQMDIDRDGYVDNVYRYAAALVDPEVPFNSGWLLSIDPGNPRAKRDMSVDGTLNLPLGTNQGRDVLLYKQTPYVLNFYNGVVIDEPRFSSDGEVYLRPYAVCAFDYRR